jgi:hypothetical protein
MAIQAIDFQTETVPRFRSYLSSKLPTEARLTN